MLVSFNQDVSNRLFLTKKMQAQSFKAIDIELYKDIQEDPSGALTRLTETISTMANGSPFFRDAKETLDAAVIGTKIKMDSQLRKCYRETSDFLSKLMGNTPSGSI